MVKKDDDDTRDGSLEERMFFIGEPLPKSNPEKKFFYDQDNCKKKNHSKEYYLCKEPFSKVYTCSVALRFGESYYCPRLEKKK